MLGGRLDKAQIRVRMALDMVAGLVRARARDKRGPCLSGNSHRPSWIEK
jgi:hypothetical protein